MAVRQDNADRDSLPRVAVVYDSASITPMVLAEAASNICRIIWVVDSADSVLAPLIRLLRRLGDVVDSAGLDSRGIAGELAPYAPDGIFTLAEDKTPLTAEVSEHLSLVYHSVEAASRLADKYLQRRALHDAGMPGPAIWKAPNSLLPTSSYSSELAALMEGVVFPVVVKPRHGTGSAATARAGDPDELSLLLARFGEREGGLLVEEYLTDRAESGPFADDLMVELLLQRGQVARLAITGKFKHAPHSAAEAVSCQAMSMLRRRRHSSMRPRRLSWQ